MPREKAACPRRALTNSVYPPRRDTSQGERTQTRRINLVGLKRRPEDGLVGGIGVCKLGVRMHAQIMASEMACVLFGVADIAQILRIGRGALWCGPIPARRYCCRAQHRPWRV